MLIRDLAKADTSYCLLGWCLVIIHLALSEQPVPKPLPFPIYYQAAAVQCWDIWWFRSLKINPMTKHFCTFYRNDRKYSIRSPLTCSGFSFYSCQESHLVKLIKPACQGERGKEQRNVNTVNLEGRVMFFLGMKWDVTGGGRRRRVEGETLHIVSIL